MGFAHLGLFAVGYLMCPHPTKTQNTFGHIFFKTLGKSLKPISNPITTEKQSFGKNVSKIIKPHYTSLFYKKTRIGKILVDTSGFQNLSKTPRKNELEPVWTGIKKDNVSKLNTRTIL